MLTLIFIDPQGARHEIESALGLSAMEAALRDSVPGIDADCGGACACATCHVHVDPSWSDRVGRAGEMEADLLEFAENVAPTSRLSCQIRLTQKLDGLILRLPASQL